MKELILLRGVPGSGKSTFADLIGGFRCEADMYFMVDGEYKFDITRIKDAHRWCKDECESYMVREKPKVIVSNTFTQEWEMESYYKLAEQYGYKVTSIIVENRHDGKNIHNVPDATLDKMRKRFEVKL
jgi:ABC-type lipoprotein export system ATPase subunit